MGSGRNKEGGDAGRGPFGNRPGVRLIDLDGH
jgi:hypothetical protein